MSQSSPDCIIVIQSFFRRITYGTELTAMPGPAAEEKHYLLISSLICVSASWQHKQRSLTSIYGRCNPRERFRLYFSVLYIVSYTTVLYDRLDIIGRWWWQSWGKIAGTGNATAAACQQYYYYSQLLPVWARRRSYLPMDSSLTLISRCNIGRYVFHDKYDKDGRQKLP